MNELPNFISIKIIENEQQQQNFKENMMFLEKNQMPQNNEKIKEDINNNKINTLICN